MSINYQKVWSTMNDLEMVTSKICSAREIIDAAIDRIQEHQHDKAEVMMSAAYEFLEYYFAEFDEKFKLAWKETVGELRDADREAYDAVMKEREYYEGKENNKSWNSFWEEMYYPEEYKGSTVSSMKKNDCMPPWGHSDIEYGLQYTDEEITAMCDAAEKVDKVKKWVLPVQQEYVDGGGEYYVNFPDDLLKAANLKEGDEVHWVDNGDETFTIVKVTKPLRMDEC